MFTGPQASINNKFELPGIKFKKGCPQRSLVARKNYNIRYILPGKQLRLIALKSLKNSTRCSGYSEKSLLIISNVHSNTFSMIMRTLSSIRFCNSLAFATLCAGNVQLTRSLLIIVDMTLRTSGSRASGTLRL